MDQIHEKMLLDFLSSNCDLTEEQKIFIYYKYIRHCSSKEISQHMGIDEKKVQELEEKILQEFKKVRPKGHRNL